MTLNKAFRGLIAFVLAASFLASPARVSADTTTFRPNAAGDYQTWSIFGGASTRWQATSDQSDSTGAQIAADTTSRETENLQDTSQTGIINSVTANIRAKATGTLAQVKYIAAGTASGVTGNPTPAYPAGLQANDLILLQVTVKDTTNTPTTPTGWTLLYGPDATTLGRQWIYYRFSNGTESGTITVNIAGTNCRIARMYAFRNVALSSFTEGGGFGSGPGPTISAQAVTTTNIDRLAVSFVFVNNDNTLASFTGETGGDWVSAATFTTTAGSDGAAQLQTAIMASAGTISGGVYTMASTDPWGVRAFALIPIDPEERAVILWRTHSADYESPAQTISRTAFANYSETRTVNPNTGSAWTWTEVNALQIGSRALTLGAGETIQCAEYWIVVDYTPCTITAPSSVCANSTGNAASVPDAGVGATYAWTITNGTITAGGGTRSITWTAGSTSPITIGITVTKGGSQCTNSTQVAIITLDCTITAPSSVYANSVGNTASVPEAGGGATYTWTITNGLITAGQGTRSITWRAGTLSPVTLGITIDISGCQCTNSVDVTVVTPSVLSVDIGGNLSFCPGASTTLTANAAGGAPPYTYLWSTDATDQSIEVTTPDTYSVTVTDSAACSSTLVSDNNTIVTRGNGSVPHNAVLAWVHPSWWSGLDYTFDYYTDNTTRWIWESYQVVNPEAGDVVFFERSFNIPSTPIGATLHVTCDNGYEAWLNGNFLGWAQLTDYGGTPWEDSDLTANWVDSGNWQTVEPYTVPAGLLRQGENVLEIQAANEQNTGGTVTSNPGGVVYDLIYEYRCNASNSVDVTLNPVPTADFTADPLSGPAPLSVQFTDTSSGATSWAWDFENNGSIDSYEQNPLHQYSSPDTYSVTLIVTNAYGCSADLTIPNYITVSEPATAPTVSIEIYDTQDCLGTPVTAMDPLTTYYAKVSIATNGEQLNQLQTVLVTLFYNSSGSDNMTAPGTGNTQTCAILTCTVGPLPSWTIDSGSPTTWQILQGGCTQPDLNDTEGDWIFAFVPGAVAIENTGAADWDAQGKATNQSSLSGELYVRDKDMNWYGEITMVTTTVDWGDVPLGLRFADAPNPKAVSIKYIANGDYYEDIQSSATWQNPPPPAPPTETVTLSSGDPPINPGEFALMADDTSELGTAISVNISYDHINDSRGLTSEDGVTITDNSLWLSLSASGILPITYNGDIHYQIAER